MSLSAEQKVQLQSKCLNLTLEDFLKKTRTSKINLHEIMIVFGIPIKQIDLFNRNLKTVDLLELCEYINEQYQLVSIIRNEDKIRLALEAIEAIKEDFLGILQELREKEQERLQRVEKVKLLKAELKQPCINFIMKLDEFLKLADKARIAANYSHLATFKEEFVRYGLLSTEEINLIRKAK